MKESSTLKLLQNWEAKTRQKATSVPSKTNDLHFFIAKGNNIEVDDLKKRHHLVSIVDMLDVEKFSHDDC